MGHSNSVLTICLFIRVFIGAAISRGDVSVAYRVSAVGPARPGLARQGEKVTWSRPCSAQRPAWPRLGSWTGVLVLRVGIGEDIGLDNIT